MIFTQKNGHPWEMTYRLCGEFRLFAFTMRYRSIIFSVPIRLIYNVPPSIIFSEPGSSDLLCFPPPIVFSEPVRLIYNV